MIMTQQVCSISYHSFEKTPEQWKKMEQQQKKIVQENTQGYKHKLCEQNQEKEKKEKKEKALWWRLLLIIILYLK